MQFGTYPFFFHRIVPSKTVSFRVDALPTAPDHRYRLTARVDGDSQSPYTIEIREDDFSIVGVTSRREGRQEICRPVVLCPGGREQMYLELPYLRLPEAAAKPSAEEPSTSEQIRTFPSASACTVYPKDRMFVSKGNNSFGMRNIRAWG